MSYGRPPSTDVGTVLLHWIIVALLIALIATGVRIASAESGLDWLGLLDPVPPVENLWYRHLVAAAGLGAALTGYAVYMVRARRAAHADIAQGQGDRAGGGAAPRRRPVGPGMEQRARRNGAHAARQRLRRHRPVAGRDPGVHDDQFAYVAFVWDDPTRSRKPIKVGHPLKVEGPFGSAFLRRRKPGRLVLVAGGTSFAPMWAVADAALRENPARPLVLIAGVRDLKSFYMWPALDRVARMPNVTVIATAEEGPPAHPAVRKVRPSDHLPQLADDDTVYAAGAPKMVDVVTKAAVAAGAAFHCDPFEASGEQDREHGGSWLNVLSWIRAA